MSRRSRRPPDDRGGRPAGNRSGGPAANRGGRPAAGRTPSAGRGGAPGRPPNRISFAGQVGILVAVFAVAVGIAELFGAANLGVAFGIGQICFGVVLVVLLLRA